MLGLPPPPQQPQHHQQDPLCFCCNWSNQRAQASPQSCTSAKCRQELAPLSGCARMAGQQRPSGSTFTCKYTKINSSRTAKYSVFGASKENAGDHKTRKLSYRQSKAVYASNNSIKSRRGVGSSGADCGHARSVATHTCARELSHTHTYALAVS